MSHTSSEKAQDQAILAHGGLPQISRTPDARLASDDRKGNAIREC